METQGFVHRSSDPPLWSSYLSVEELTKEPGFFQPYPHQTIPRIKLGFASSSSWFLSFRRRITPSQTFPMAHHKLGSSRATPSRLRDKSPRVTSESKLVSEGIKMLKYWNGIWRLGCFGFPLFWIWISRTSGGGRTWGWSWNMSLWNGLSHPSHGVGGGYI